MITTPLAHSDLALAVIAMPAAVDLRARVTTMGRKNLAD